jgi:hypothetical protein
VGYGATTADVLDTVTARSLRSYVSERSLKVEWTDAEGLESYLALDDGSLLEDLSNSILLLSTAELSLKSSLGGRVEGALVAVPVEGTVSHAVHESPCHCCGANGGGV